MSSALSLSTQHSALSTPSSRWLPLADAAQRSGKHPDSLSRRCREEWAAAGLAEMRSPEAGGKPIWFIAESADPLFSPARSPEHLPFNPETYTRPQLDRILFKKKILDDWQVTLVGGRKLGFTDNQTTEQYLLRLAAQGIKGLCRATLFGWRKKFDADGMTGLFDGRTGKEKQVDADTADFRAELCRWYLDQGETKIMVCYRLARAKFRAEGKAFPSYDTAKRYLKSLPRPDVILARRGKEEYDNLCGGYAERDYTTLRVNQIWCGDHHPCDVIVHWQGKLIRPWMSAWEDMRSRRVFAIYTPMSPDTDTILAALKFAIDSTELAIPETCFVDCGRDYDSYGLQGETKRMRFGRMKLRVRVDEHLAHGALRLMQIGVQHARPYNPRSKPIERFFRTYSEGFDCLEPTYTGNKPENKPDHLLPRLNKFPDVGHVVPSFEEYARRGGEWIEGEYNARPHTGHGMDGRSPIWVYNELLETKRTTTRQAVEIACVKPERPVKIRRNGVHYMGTTYGRGNRVLAEHQTEMVHIRVDPLDVSQVSVWNLDGTFLCHAQANTRIPWGATKPQLKKVLGEISREERAAKQLGIKNPRATVDAAERLIADRTATTPPPPPSQHGVKVIQTGFEHQTAAFEQSKNNRVRRAVGFDLTSAADDLDVDNGPRRRMSLVSPDLEDES